MRFSSATFAVLFGLVAAAVAAPMNGDAASDLYARDFDAEVFERDFYDSVYERSEDGLEARAGETVDVKIKFIKSEAGTAAKKEDAMHIVEHIMKQVGPKLKLVAGRGNTPAELGKVIATNEPLNPLRRIHFKFSAPACGSFCEVFATVVEGGGGVNAIQVATVKTHNGEMLWEKKAHE